MRRDKSFADDLIVHRGAVSSRVALLLRSAEAKPSIDAQICSTWEPYTPVAVPVRVRACEWVRVCPTWHLTAGLFLLHSVVSKAHYLTGQPTVIMIKLMSTQVSDTLWWLRYSI